MRERSVKVNIDKLVELGDLHTGKVVAERLGVSAQMFSYLKRGKRDVTESMLTKICNEFSLDPKTLLANSQ